VRAVVFNQSGDPSVLHVEERPVPELSENEVLIKVVAAGVNRPDIIQRRGHYPAPKGIVQDILGLEVSGYVEKIGRNVTQWKIGQQVMSLVPGGGYAEYVSVDAGSCLPIPKGILLDEAAALPEVLFTVWHNVFQRGHAKTGDTILIYGGSGGIGSMAIQLAHLANVKVLTLASLGLKSDFCYNMGANQVIDYKDKDLINQIGADTVDVILDSVGGDYLDINLEALKEEGRLIYINAMEGGNPPLDIKKVMRKRLHITGSTLRARSYDFKRDLAGDIYKNAFPLLENENFKSMVRYKFPLDQAGEAHRLMESRDFIGKIILNVD
jgi:NADPH2:quinone reductase